MNVVYAIGRMLITILFIVAGAGKFINIAGTESMLAAKGIPQPTAAAYLVAAIELIGGLMVLVGYKTRWAALALLIFTGITIVFGHNFWDMTGAQYIANRTQALKNLSIMAGLLMLIAHGSGKLSVDGRSG